MGDRLEAHEKPWGQRDDVKRLRHRVLAFGEWLGEGDGGAGSPGAAYEGGREHDGDTGGENESKRALRARGDPCAEAQQRPDCDSRGGEKKVAYAYYIPRKRVERAEREAIPEEGAGHDGQGRGVGPDDRGIREAQKLGAYEAMVDPEGVAHVCLGITSLAESPRLRKRSKMWLVVCENMV